MTSCCYCLMANIWVWHGPPGESGLDLFTHKMSYFITVHGEKDLNNLSSKVLNNDLNASFIGK